VHGQVRAFRLETELRDHLRRLTDKFESGKEPRWSLQDLSESFLSRLSGHICGFSIAIARIEAKFKLGQNRSRQDIQGTTDALRKSTYLSDREFVEFSVKYYSKLQL
jgi:transcriptional regulator